jgi:hypothetical protein
MKRQPDGKWRGPRQPMMLSQGASRARWVEQETLRLKQMGMPYEEIAKHITRVGRLQAPPLISLPDGVKFPPHYKISTQGCHKAFQKIMAREPSLAVDEFRKLDNARTEEMFLNLEPLVRERNVRAIEARLKLLNHSVQVNGYAAPQKHTDDWLSMNAIPIAAVREAIAIADAEEATIVRSTSPELAPSISAEPPLPTGGVASATSDHSEPGDQFASLNIELSPEMLEKLREEPDEETE